MQKRKIRMGMIGGGLEGFIGATHRKAAFLDGHIDLVCGAFSSNAKTCITTGETLYLEKNRCYASYTEMIKEEALLPSHIRMDFVAIVTPNHLHYPMAKLALEHGFHVMCDKPLCFEIKEAEELQALCKKKHLIFGLTHAYTSYPMVKQMRKMIEDNKLGEIRKVIVEYPQGWLSTPLEDTNHKQALWRMNKEQAGISCCMADIGTHCLNLLEYVTQLEVQYVCADLSTYGKNRSLDDDGNVLLRLNKEVKGILHASQISVGEENDLNIRIYGEKASISWSQMTPNTLAFKQQDKIAQVYSAGAPYLEDIAKYNTRLPSGHPEGLLEAFANLYRNFAFCIQNKQNNQNSKKENLDFPGIKEGIRGMLFMQACVYNSKSGEKWTKVEQKKVEQKKVEKNK